MKFTILCVADKPPAWARDAFQVYQKRLPKWLDLSIRFCNKSLNKSAKTRKSDEAKTLEKYLKPEHFLVALDVRGKSVTSEKLAEKLSSWQHLGRDIVLIIGGPDGLDPGLLNRADWRWSLSDLTLPHAFVPVIISEAIYRAHCILTQHPYHRA